MKEYKILLVDDHEIIINGIMNALLPWPHFKIVEHVKNGLEVYNAWLASNEYSGLHSIPTRVYDH